MKLSSKHLTVLSLLTIIGFSGIGLIIIHFFQNKSLTEFFIEKVPLQTQVITGISFGFSGAFAAVVLIKSPFMRKTFHFFTRLIGEFNPSIYNIIFYSGCAAIGEEILFRGAIQFYLGIWLTSLLFIFIHGYLNPFNPEISVYGILMVIISGGLGYLFKLFGIYSAITAHFLFDLILFIVLKYSFIPKRYNDRADSDDK